jgi:MEMO1 family protein
MPKRFLVALALGVVVAGFLGASMVRIRVPSAAGALYPEQHVELGDMVKAAYAQVTATPPPGRVIACIMPHGPYSSSAAIAAAALKYVDPKQFDRVVILAPSHFADFRGCSIPAIQAFRTPLGDVVMDGPVIRKLTWSPLIDHRALYEGSAQSRARVHEDEYSIEAVLPFLQVHMLGTKIVPILVGHVRGYQDKREDPALDAIARDVRPVIDDRTLLVVSSDLTHYGEAFKYVPFRENVNEQLETLDNTALHLIVNRDYKEFVRFIEESKVTICGKEAIALLLKLLPRDARGMVMGYARSVDDPDAPTRSVGHAAVVFYRP